MKMKNKKQKGITLIALIITIVILLILAAVTIDVAIDGKLFDTAKDAVDKTNDRVSQVQAEIDEIMSEWEKLEGNGTGGEIPDTTPPEEEIVTATVIDQNPTLYYGKEVENYGVIYDNTADASNKWRIFYADENNIYLIADDYIHIDYAPDAGIYEINSYDGTNYVLSLDEVSEYYDGAEDIDSTFGEKWLSEYYPTNKTSTNFNIRKVAYMLDTSIWNPIYKNDYAEYAVGGPTLEMYCASYKDTHQSKYIEYTADSTGYQVKWNGGSNDVFITGVPQDEYNSIYVKSDDSKANALWLASPSAGNTWVLMLVSFDRKSVRIRVLRRP